MRDLLNEIIDTLQATFPVNRLVALLTPAFALAAGAVSVWLTEHFPGIENLVDLSPGAISVIFVGGVLSVLTAAYKWLDGWQAYEDREGLPLPPEPVDPDADFDPEAK